MPTLAEVLDGTDPANTAAVRVETAAGTFSYSGGGYAVAQQLIVDSTGRSLAQAASDVVFEPIGMVDSTFDQTAPRLDGGRSTRRLAPLSGSRRGRPLDDSFGPRCVRLAIQRAAAGRSSPLDAATARAMISPTVALPAEGDWNILPSLGLRAPDRYGIGFFLKGTDRFSHLGAPTASSRL